MNEFVVILVIAICVAFLAFIAFTLNSISHDLFRIRKILDDHEHELTESCIELTESRIKEYIETGKITH